MSRRKRMTFDQRGSASLELTLLVPALALLLGLVTVGGRLWFARSAVTEAAYSAARAASLARTAGQAVTDGVAAADRELQTNGLHCQSHSVGIDVSAFRVPVGQPATVSSRIFCLARLTDVAFPGMPGSMVIETTGASALDTYRERQ